MLQAKIRLNRFASAKISSLVDGSKVPGRQVTDSGRLWGRLCALIQPHGLAAGL